MYVLNRHAGLFSSLIVAAALLLWPGVAAAWVETQLRSDVVTVDVEPSGAALVSHELLMRIRGGPLKSWELSGVDGDAIPLPNATVSEVASNGAPAAPIPLLLERRDDGSLRIEIDREKGLRRGTYLFKLSYRTDLAARGMIEPNGSHVDLRWVGPRLADGVDSVRVTFRLPPAQAAPRLPVATGEHADEGTSVLLSSLRRAQDKDELELVRPHVAKGEPVEWRIQVSHRVFPAFESRETPAEATVPTVKPPPPERRAAALGGLLGLALFYALIVFLKWRSLRSASELRQATPRALIPLPVALRATAAGGLLAAAVAVGARTAEPTLAGVLLALSIAFATQLPARGEPTPRRPGRWLPFADADAFAPQRERLPGGFLDAGALPGFLLFVLGLGGFGALATVLFSRSPYHAVMVALASACLLPIFCTGRGAELPADPARAPVKTLRWLAERLRADEAVKVVPWARVPTGAGEPDELRLLLMPRKPVTGLTAIEIGVEQCATSGGALGLPWIMVRAQEGSAAHALLPQGVTWTRGRKPEERVAVLRPSLPTRAACLALARSLVDAFTDRAPARRGTRQPAIKLPISVGKGSSTSRAGTVASPAQAT